MPIFTAQHCLICYKCVGSENRIVGAEPTTPTSSSTNNHLPTDNISKNSEICHRFCTLAGRVYDLDPFFFNLEKTLRTKSLMCFDKACNSCAQLLSSFCDIYENVQCLQFRLDFKAHQILQVLCNADDEKSGHLNYRKELEEKLNRMETTLKDVDYFRQSLKQSLNETRINHFPELKINRESVLTKRESHQPEETGDSTVGWERKRNHNAVSLDVLKWKAEATASSESDSPVMRAGMKKKNTNPIIWSSDASDSTDDSMFTPAPIHKTKSSSLIAVQSNLKERLDENGSTKKDVEKDIVEVYRKIKHTSSNLINNKKTKTTKLTPKQTPTNNNLLRRENNILRLMDKSTKRGFTTTQKDTHQSLLTKERQKAYKSTVEKRQRKRKDNKDIPKRSPKRITRSPFSGSKAPTPQFPIKTNSSFSLSATKGIPKLDYNFTKSNTFTSAIFGLKTCKTDVVEYKERKVEESTTTDTERMSKICKLNGEGRKNEIGSSDTATISSVISGDMASSDIIYRRLDFKFGTLQDIANRPVLMEEVKPGTNRNTVGKNKVNNSQQVVSDASPLPQVAVPVHKEPGQHICNFTTCNKKFKSEEGLISHRANTGHRDLSI